MLYNKTMKKVLILTVTAGNGHNSAANAMKNKLQENGYEVKVVDIIKDIEEAKYYHSISKAMEEKEENNYKYYTPYYPERERTYPIIWNDSKIKRWNNDTDMRDMNEGRSPQHRKMYMESKKLHKDPTEQMKELKIYMEELSNDITEMIENATTEEKTILQHKLNELAQKVSV